MTSLENRSDLAQIVPEALLSACCGQNLGESDTRVLIAKGVCLPPTRALVGAGDGHHNPFHVGAGLLAFGPIEV